MSEGTFIIDGADILTDFQTPGRRVVLSLGDKPDFVPGRRSWVQYRELGVTRATGGTMRAQIIHAGTSNESTGWHVHRCDVQFLYVVSGAIHVAFSPDQIIRLEAGDSLMIPGGTVHTELGAAEAVEVLEISVPADMGTDPVDTPWGNVKLDAGKATRPHALAA